MKEASECRHDSGYCQFFGTQAMIQPTPEFYSALEPSETFLAQLDRRMWLMDNHKWACWVWEKCLGRTAGHRRPALLHFDYHFDGINDFYDDPEATAALLAETVEQLKQRIKVEERIGYDSFIAPALLRGVIGDVHFYCLQSDTDPGIDTELLEQSGVIQAFYTSVEEAARVQVDQSYVFDLCLDLFNRDDDKTYQGDLWSDAEIKSALSVWEHLIINADCVTLSLSFGYSGTEDQTRHLASLVVPEILVMLGKK